MSAGARSRRRGHGAQGREALLPLLPHALCPLVAVRQRWCECVASPFRALLTLNATSLARYPGPIPLHLRPCAGPVLVLPKQSGPKVLCSLPDT